MIRLNNGATFESPSGFVITVVSSCGGRVWYNTNISTSWPQGAKCCTRKEMLSMLAAGRYVRRKHR